jgi:uncharacterized protein YcnI
MPKKTLVLALGAGTLALAPTAAEAHVSLHPNAWPAGSQVTTNIRVPNEQDNANTTSIRVKLPDGVLGATGAPPAGWTFKAKTKKLDKPIKTDDGLVTSTVTEVDYTGGKIAPGQFQNFPLTISVPDSAKAGAVLSFPTIQTYSNGQVVRWIGAASADKPAPTVDITAAGGPILDVTGGDAGPPAKLPATITGAGNDAPAPAAAKPTATVTKTVVKKETNNGLAIVALILGALGLVAGGLALARRRA